MEENISIEPIKLSDVERMVESIRKNVGDVDVDLSFEFMLTAFFPTCWNNVRDALNRQYTLGYIGGLRESNKSEKIEEDLECFCE